MWELKAQNISSTAFAGKNFAQTRTALPVMKGMPIELVKANYQMVLLETLKADWKLLNSEIRRVLILTRKNRKNLLYMPDQVLVVNMRWFTRSITTLMFTTLFGDGLSKVFGEFVLKQKGYIYIQLLSSKTIKDVFTIENYCGAEYEKNGTWFELKAKVYLVDEKGNRRFAYIESADDKFTVVLLYPTRQMLVLPSLNDCSQTSFVNWCQYRVVKTIPVYVRYNKAQMQLTLLSPCTCVRINKDKRFKYVSAYCT